jgi:hypothetical protein
MDKKPMAVEVVVLTFVVNDTLVKLESNGINGTTSLTTK